MLFLLFCFFFFRYIDVVFTFISQKKSVIIVEAACNIKNIYYTY